MNKSLQRHGKRPQASVSKAKEKELNDLEILTRIVKSLTNEMDELNRRKIENTISGKPPKLILRRNSTSGSNNNQLNFFSQSSNVVLNIKNFGTNSYFMFHNEHHSEKM